VVRVAIVKDDVCGLGTGSYDVEATVVALDDLDIWVIR
jgi:hypothetical protein